MIACVYLNPAIDTTYSVRGLQHSATNRVDVAWRKSGGKALNVARVLHELHEPVIIAGLAGGPIGVLPHTDLAEADINTWLTPNVAQTRAHHDHRRAYRQCLDGP